MRLLRPAAAAVGAMALSLTLSAGGQPSPLDAASQLHSAHLLFNDGRYRDAVEALRRARVAAPKELALPIADALVTALLRIGDFASALAEADEIVADEPQSALALAIHADALWAMGQFPESERAVRASLEADPVLARAHHALARVLAARTRLGEASTEALAATSGDPTSAEAQFTLGVIDQRRGDFAAAAAAFTRYVNLIPNRDKSEKALWTRAQIRFLSAFAGRQPNAIDPAAPPVVSVPFKLAHDKIVVAAKVNGSPVDLVLDTGAEMTVLSPYSARLAGVRPITWMRTAGVGNIGLRSLQVAAIDRLDIGALRMRNLPCLIKNPPLAELPAREADAFSPVALGLSMKIDYVRRTLTMGRHVEAEEGATELPMWVHRLAMVEGVINGTHRANFVVDTGGEVVSLSHETADVVDPNPPRKIPVKVYGSSGWDREAFLLQNVSLLFAGLRVPSSSMVVLDLRAPSALLGFRLGGIVGHTFLSRYTVTLDLERGVLALGRAEAVSRATSYVQRATTVPRATCGVRRAVLSATCQVLRAR